MKILLGNSVLKLNASTVTLGLTHCLTLGVKIFNVYLVVYFFLIYVYELLV